LPRNQNHKPSPDGLADGEKLPLDEPVAVAPVPKSGQPTETEAEHFERLLGRLNALHLAESEAQPDEPEGAQGG
jgi:hypothetical protein